MTWLRRSTRAVRETTVFVTALESLVRAVHRLVVATVEVAVVVTLVMTWRCESLDTEGTGIRPPPVTAGAYRSDEPSSRSRTAASRRGTRGFSSRPLICEQEHDERDANT